MKVSQLIEILSGFPKDAPVLMELSPLDGSRRDLGNVRYTTMFSAKGVPATKISSLYLCGYIEETYVVTREKS
jgi:hypothetical protein